VPILKDSNRDESKHLSKKELAKQFRHEAYLRAKEYRKTDPRQIAMVEKLKDQRKDAYRKAKERDKAYRAGQKKASNEKAVRKKNATREKMRAMVVSGSTLKTPFQI
jgi:hypothetical protein